MAAVPTSSVSPSVNKNSKDGVESFVMLSANPAMDERRPVTILFTDIVGSTALAEQLDPEEWKEIVNGAHQVVSAAVTRYQGMVAQLLGDGVLAFFGAPHAHEDDPARAVKAGLEIQRAITEYAHTLQGYVDEFQMRVGIHTGMVVVGAVGSAEHPEYLAVGDAVNLAARMQSAAKPGRVLLSDTTARLVRHAFDLYDLGELSVKGKTEPVHVFEVKSQRAVVSSGRGIEGLTSPLVGREHALAQLRDALQQLDSGHGQVVFVLGEAGIGKTRLVQEARKYNSHLPSPELQNPKSEIGNLKWLEGRALSYGQALPFWAITQLIQNDLGLADGEPEVRVKVALRRRVKQLFAEKTDEILPYLAQLLGVKLEGDAATRVKALDGETLKRQTLLSLGEYFTRVADMQPTVLVLEDLHWADPSTLETLVQLFTLTNRVPLMLLALMRVERDHGSWRVMQAARTDYEHRYTELNLKPLSAAEQDHLVSNLLETAELPDRTRRLILERAEGNPLYLEEIIRNLIEQGALIHENNHWRSTTEITTVAIPDTLQGVLLARMDRLQDDVRRTLQLASVIGKTFLFRLLQAIAEAERQLETHLAQLQRADLVREKARRPELEYIFKHSLTQEVAYDSLLLERRREFHRRVGEAFENLFADRQDEFLGLLAHHFDRAGDQAKAIDYLLRAGDKTRLGDAHDEAIQYYLRAVELLQVAGDAGQEARTWLKLGLLYHANFEFEKAHDANEKAFELKQRAVRARRTEIAPAGLDDSKVLVFLTSRSTIVSLDPPRMRYTGNTWAYWNLFAGLVELDAEFNVIPNVARSWEVLDEGTRYVFHLREDVHWTDKTTVTAFDFEWAWKRNLMPIFQPIYAQLLDEVIGARAFRQGRNSDPDSIGVKALDPHTLQVQLQRPVAYFPYVVGYPITFPLHRATVERYGDEWWKPPHIVSNGAYRLIRLSEDYMVWERNRDFFGDFVGNVGRVEFRVIGDDDERRDAFLQGEGDLIRNYLLNVAAPFETARWQHDPTLTVNHLIFNAQLPPLDDVRVRRALAHALDVEAIAAIQNYNPAHGGMVHPGAPGHSPGLNFRFDPDAARRLFAEAGYPDGVGFPPLVMEFESSRRRQSREELARQWRDALNVRTELREVDRHDPGKATSHLGFYAYIGDYPDPDTFLRQPLAFYRWLNPETLGARYMQLVEDAVQVQDRAQRMSMYREADRILVAERVLLIPLDYGAKSWEFVLHPWVKGVLPTSAGEMSLLKQAWIEPH